MGNERISRCNLSEVAQSSRHCAMSSFTRSGHKFLAAAGKMVGKCSLSMTKEITECNDSILNQREQTSNNENVQSRLRISNCDQRMSE